MIHLQTRFDGAALSLVSLRVQNHEVFADGCALALVKEAQARLDAHQVLRTKCAR
jgi:hypothetical protein